jgi:hypothetical protein
MLSDQELRAIVDDEWERSLTEQILAKEVLALRRVAEAARTFAPDEPCFSCVEYRVCTRPACVLREALTALDAVGAKGEKT